MEFKELKEEEFKKFANKHEQSSFYQTINWGKLKEKNGWKMHLLGVKEKNKVLCAALILEKNMVLNRTMFYSPRGFLIDYNNYELLEFFTNELKKYLKKHKAIFLKIDPYIIYQERDINGDVVENGKNNKIAFNNLTKLKYKHFGFNKMQEELQPRWVFCTDTKNTTVDEVIKNMDSKTRQILRRNERNHITIREINKDEIDKFKEIMQHTGERRNFIDRPLSYYQNMYDYLHDDGILKILIAELDTKKLIIKYQEEVKKFEKEKKDKLDKFSNSTQKINEEKLKNKIKDIDNNISRLNKNIEHISDLKNKYGDILTLGGILFLIHGNEVLSLVGGSYDKFMEFQSAYNVHFAGLKYAIENNYDRYNFYGITGVFDESNSLYGLYLFKKDFGGYVVELIGEFDYIINRFWYFIYKFGFNLYGKVKMIMFKIKERKKGE